MLIYYKYALLHRSDRWISEQELQPALVDLLWVPPRLREKPLQALRFLSLCSGHRLGVGKSGQSLVAFGG
jgi:hypothetical protein